MKVDTYPLDLQYGQPGSRLREAVDYLEGLRSDRTYNVVRLITEIFRQKGRTGLEYVATITGPRTLAHYIGQHNAAGLSRSSLSSIKDDVHIMCAVIKGVGECDNPRGSSTWCALHKKAEAHAQNTARVLPEAVYQGPEPIPEPEPEPEQESEAPMPAVTETALHAPNPAPAPGTMDPLTAMLWAQLEPHIKAAAQEAAQEALNTAAKKILLEARVL